MQGSPARGGSSQHQASSLSHSPAQGSQSRGGGRGRGAGRGARGGPPRSGQRGGQPPGSRTTVTSLVVDPQRLPVTTTIGVRRPGYGKAGKTNLVDVNAGEITTPEGLICQYDVTIQGPSKKAGYPTRLTQQLIKQLQHDTAPKVFLPAGVYDGKKILMMPHKLEFEGGNDSATFNVPVTNSPDRPPTVYTISLTHVKTINTEVLDRFINAQQSYDENVAMTITAMNVSVRQEPIMRGFAFNTRAFFPNTADTLSAPTMGLQFGRGIFQSVRPTFGRMLLNVDTTTAMFYQSGPLIELCLGYLAGNQRGFGQDPNKLGRLSDRERIALQRFISGIRVQVNSGTKSKGKIITIAKLTNVGANAYKFKQRDGKEITVAAYFKKAHNKALQLPNVICAQTSSGAAIPLELLTVLPGQIARKQVPPEVTAAMVSFSQLKPQQRMAEIKKGVELLSHGQSDYIRNFGMSVDANFPIAIEARVLKPPTLHYGAKITGKGKGALSQVQSVDPSIGAWNLIDKTLIQPQSIARWTVIIFVPKPHFAQNIADELVTSIISAFASVGMTIAEKDPIIVWANSQGDVSAQLHNAGGQTARKSAGPDGRPVGGPDLLLVVLPDFGNTELYRQVKHFGDVERGVATQCLQAGKCRKARIQYWANVALKVNPKLGGINHKPDPSSACASDLNDPNNPTIVMGADVMHPPPGSDGPSYTAVVANVDSDVAKYIAQSRVQTGRVEIIEDLYKMVKALLEKYMNYRKFMEKKANFTPVRLLFFRDGVSEGQYAQVRDLELKVIRQACVDLKINPKITFVIVAKRHHFRFFPQNPTNFSQADKSGNCPSGTVIDKGITHPTEFDFYLQSHGGLLGTSRSAHYHILEDDTGFSADAMQSLCFGLCHVFARSTRTISVPAPVAYADIVCSRGQNHYKTLQGMADTASMLSGGTANSSKLEQLKADFKPIHKNHETRTFFT